MFFQNPGLCDAVTEFDRLSLSSVSSSSNCAFCLPVVNSTVPFVNCSVLISLFLLDNSS